MKRSLLVLTIALAFNVQSVQAMGALKAAISASRAVGEGAKIASEGGKVAVEGAKLASEGGKLTEEALQAEEAAKAISNVKKLNYYRFEYRGYKAIPDLERGGYMVQKIGSESLPQYYRNTEEVKAFVDAFLRATQ